jgi:hypothetical protein
VASARFVDTASLVSSDSFPPPVAPAKKVGVIAWLWPLLAAALLLILICCCLVLFLVWRRRTTEYSTKTDEAGIEPGPFMFEEEEEPFYPHEYWNPLDESASPELMLDMGDGEEDVLELSDSGFIGDDFFDDDLDVSEPSLDLEEEGPDFGHEYWNPLDESGSPELMLDMGDGEEDMLELSDSGFIGDDFFDDDLDVSEPSLDLEEEGPDFGHEYWNPLDDDATELSDGVFADAHAAPSGDEQNPPDMEDVPRYDDKYWNPLDDGRETSPEFGAEEPYSDPDDLAFTDRPSSDESLAFVSDSAYSVRRLGGEGTHGDLSPDFEEARRGDLEEEDIDELASDTQDLAFDDDYGFE